MFVMQTATAALTGLTFTGASIPAEPADAMIVFICIFVSCFAFSWGPLGWLVCPCSPRTPTCVTDTSGMGYLMRLSEHLNEHTLQTIASYFQVHTNEAAGWDTVTQR